MPEEGYDWLLRPIVKGMCRFESLKNGDVDLADIALMNDALSVASENEAIAYRMNQNGK